MNNKFTAKAMCLFVHKGKLLLYENHSSDGIHFYRPPGGHIERGEYAHQAVEREVKEELGAKIKNVKLWRTIENIFATKEKLRLNTCSVLLRILLIKSFMKKSKSRHMKMTKNSYFVGITKKTWQNTRCSSFPRGY